MGNFHGRGRGIHRSIRHAASGRAEVEGILRRSPASRDVDRNAHACQCSEFRCGLAYTGAEPNVEPPCVEPQLARSDSLDGTCADFETLTVGLPLAQLDARFHLVELRHRIRIEVLLQRSRRLAHFVAPLEQGGAQVHARHLCVVRAKRHRPAQPGAQRAEATARGLHVPGQLGPAVEPRQVRDVSAHRTQVQP